MFNFLKRFTFFMFLFVVCFSAAHFAMAQADLGVQYGEEIGLSDTDPRIVIARVIQVALGFLGIIAVVLILYAGWLWMTSEGDSGKIDLAKKTLVSAIIGLVIILSSFAIASFVLNKLMDSAGSGNGDPISNDNGGNSHGIGAMGNKIIETHYPARNEQDVPRNAKIIITFKEPINPTSIMNGMDINDANIKIYATDSGVESALSGDRVAVSKTADNKTYIFSPDERFDKNKWYTIALGSEIKKVNGENAFSGATGYDWSFDVSENIDLTPPQIESVAPVSDSSEPRNTVIQINFNEPIDPTTIISPSGFINVSSGAAVAGNFYVSNNYKTVEFLTEENCGVNSCGEKVYCLPGGQKINTLIKAANLAAAGESTAKFPYDGVVDLAGNSLDGNGNGAAEGPSSDSYSWNFNTTNEVISSAPKIISYGPSASSGVALDSMPEATFDRIILGSSIVKGTSVKIAPEPGFYDTGKRNDSAKKQSTVYIRHEGFSEKTSYTPEFTSGIKDIYQNCYTPCEGSGAK